MKAGVFFKANDLRVIEIEKPTPKKDEVLIKVMACGVCGTDVHIFCGDEGCFPTPSGTVLGHEFSGIVEKVGDDVKEIKVGDRVCVDPNQLCGECYYCKSGIGHFCEQMTGIGTGVNGGFAEFCAVPQSQVYKIKDTTTYEEDPSLMPGQEKVVQAGHAGYKVTTYKEVRYNGQIVSKDVISSDTYSPMRTIKKVAPGMIPVAQ